MKTPMNTIETPLSKVVIPYNGRWKNNIFKREHQRIRRREEGLKQRIRVLDDGTKFSDAFPESVTYYQHRPKVLCPICNVEIYNGRWNGHLESVKHKQNIELVNRLNSNRQFHIGEIDQNCDQSDQCA